MPLSEPYRMAKGKFGHNQQKNNSSSTDPAFIPVNDFAELVWENGQILMQGQSSRQRKTSNSNTLQSYDLPSNSNTLPSYDLPSQTLKPRNKDIGNSTTNSKSGKFGTTADCIMNDFLLNQDDEMAHWLNYHIDDDSLQQDYCSDFLTGLSGVTENELSTSQSNCASIEKRSDFDHNHSNSVNNRVSVEPKAFGGEFCKPKTSQLYPLSSPQQASLPSGSSISNATSNATNNAVCENLSMKAQNQDSRPPKSSSGFVNFSNFSRPASMIKANLQNSDAFASPRLPSEERIGYKDKESLPELSHIDLTENLCNGLSSQSQPMMASDNVNMKFLMDKTIDEPRNVEQSNANCHADASKNDKIQSRTIGSNSYKEMADIGERTIEGAVASSSTCSVSSVDKISNDPPHDLKRKCRDIEECDYPSDDVEEESGVAKKTTTTRGGSGSKRGRAAEVHNLSERKRRDRINEKMRALQELIPNCNKVDKASMLDEAIEYLKTLQIQVQIMSMGAGPYMRPMMLPMGMQHMHAAHMSHFSSMGMGMGFGMGMVDANGGSPGYPVMPVLPMQGGHFRGPQILGPPSMNGMSGSNHRMFGLAAQGHPMPMTQTNSLSSWPSLSIPGPGGPVRNLHSAQAFSSKDPSMNNMQVMQHTDTIRLMDRTSSQETNQGFEHSASMLKKDQAADVSGSGTRDSQS